MISPEVTPIVFCMFLVTLLRLALGPRMQGIFYLFLFIIFMIPFSIQVGIDGVSANYLYVFFPFFIILLQGKVKHPGNYVLLIMAMYFLILFASIFYQLDYVAFIERRIMSFTLFMFIFSFMFTDIDDEMIVAFKRAIVILSFYFILITIYKYIDAGGNSLGYKAKGMFGTQRFGFVYCMALWIVASYKPKIRIMNIFKWLGIFLVIIGILLTFSRSSVVGLIGGLVVYFIYSYSYSDESRKVYLNHRFRRWFLQWTKIGLGFAIIIFVIKIFNPLILNFYLDRMFSLLTGAVEIELHFESSEGYRLYMLQRVLELVLENPLTGSGYLGIWVLFDDMSGTTHNQYSDILFRVGIFGFAAFMFLLFKLFKFLSKNYQDLFIGFVSVLAVSLFHETFKLSQGSFILAFLLGMMATQHRSQKRVVSNNNLPK